MAQQLKRWQGWLLFGGSMVGVFVLGLIVSSLLARRAEGVSIYTIAKTYLKILLFLPTRSLLKTSPVNIKRGQ